MKSLILLCSLFSLNAFSASVIPLFDKNYISVGSIEVSGREEVSIANFIAEKTSIQNFNFVDRVEIKGDSLTLYIGSYENPNSNDFAILSYDKNDMQRRASKLKYSF